MAELGRSSLAPFSAADSAFDAQAPEGTHALAFAADLRAFGHRSRTLQMGYTRQDWEGKPVIAIINTWSDINHCHTHFRQRAEEVKRGVWQAGGAVALSCTSISTAFSQAKFAAERAWRMR